MRSTNICFPFEVLILGKSHLAQQKTISDGKKKGKVDLPEGDFLPVWFSQCTQGPIDGLLSLRIPWSHSIFRRSRFHRLRKRTLKRRVFSYIAKLTVLFPIHFCYKKVENRRQ